MLLQNPQIRIDLPDPEPTVWPGQNRDLRVHRNLIQQKKKTLLPELPHTRTIRKIKPIKSSLTYCPVFCSKSINYGKGNNSQSFSHASLSLGITFPKHTPLP